MGPEAPTYDERRWLHDKLERLAIHEDRLMSYRSSFFAAVTSALAAGQFVAVAYLHLLPHLFWSLSAALAFFGAVSAVPWAMLLHRTATARRLWRAAARELERRYPPLSVAIPFELELVEGAPRVVVDAARPFEAHRRAFHDPGRISWFDRIGPTEVSPYLPMALGLVWAALFAVAGIEILSGA